MTNTALITGASAGIGEELARVHAEKGGDLILVARRKDRLESIAKDIRAEHGVQVQVLAADLAKSGAAKKLMADVDALGAEVDVLINNAGFGGHGKFHESGLERDQRMMQLNMVALTELAYYFAQGMVERGSGKILNVGSTAGFLPGPLQAVYYASKAYVNSFSQAIANELQGTGVTVTVLCPGPVATEFQEAGDLDGVKGFDLAADARSVALCGYRAMERGELLAVNDRKIRVLLEGVLPFLPRKSILWMSRKTMEKSS
ncbi:SDR family oxidoreductase [Congregibacter variabilis]|uniref:SDR family oxidoreductase n=1 Tax=Congregibacter variabilis TaxID=3081200 RepID=A0ABZ0I3F0_9GAMM|nr:SDR family oxidoreductase [Congregibacter sp. IMCC43200]